VKQKIVITEEYKERMRNSKDRNLKSTATGSAVAVSHRITLLPKELHQVLLWQRSLYSLPHILVASSLKTTILMIEVRGTSGFSHKIL
jgi:hypothetical protein